MRFCTSTFGQSSIKSGIAGRTLFPSAVHRGRVVRATRAYIAGFGTAGSILACAVVVFVIASAVITINGWPSLSAQSSPSAVQITQAATSNHSRVNRLVNPNAGHNGGVGGAGGLPGAGPGATLVASAGIGAFGGGGTRAPGRRATTGAEAAPAGVAATSAAAGAVTSTEGV